MKNALLTLVLACTACIFAAAQPTATKPADPLPSWHDGESKAAIVSFIAKVTNEGSPDYVKPEERIAVFDNDGTLWSEQPAYFQLLFAFDEVKRMAPDHPEWKEKEPFKSILAGDMKGAMSGGDKAILEVVAATHAGMSTEQFAENVKKWLATAQHPKFKRPFNTCIYQPMVEVLTYLRANGFKTFIVSGGGVEFMRPWVEEAYGIPPEQVVGSSGAVKFEFKDGKSVLTKEPKVEFIDDGPGKPVGINRFIGRRPIMAFGNSDGDRQMLEYTTSGPGARFGLLVHHTDGEREFAYDRHSPFGKLDKALDEAATAGWTVVDMKKEWKTVFPASK